MFDQLNYMLSSSDYFLIAFSFVTSLVSAWLGVGGGVLLLAALVTLYPPSVVIPLHGMVQLFSNGFRACLLWRYVQWKLVLAFAVGAFAGSLLGLPLLVTLEQLWLELMLASFMLYLVWGPSLPAVPVVNRLVVVIGGLTTSFASLFIGASGPLVFAFIQRVKMTKEALVATHATAMLVQHGVKVLVFGFVGFAFHDYLILLLAMVAAGFIGTYVGKRLLLSLSESLFRQAYKVTITILAFRLLYSALVS